MASCLKLYLFGDQTFDIKPLLIVLLAKRDHPVLEDYLAKAYIVIRAQIDCLPLEEKEHVGRFTCLEDLVRGKRGGRPCLPLDMALTCLYQVGEFINQQEFFSDASDDSRAIGLCTGTLAVAVVSCSRSTLELVTNGLQAIIVAFRTGLRVLDSARRVARVVSADESWSVILSGSTSSEEAVQTFNGKTALPSTRKPYISAYSRSGITMSGPPSSLALLVDSDALKNIRSKHLPIHGPFHAPHLYSETDVDGVLDGIATAADAVESLHQLLPIPSTRASSRQDGHTFPALLRHAVVQILLCPLRWPVLLGELESHLEKTKPKSFAVIPIATTAQHLISNELRQKSHPYLTNMPEMIQTGGTTSSTAARNGKKPKLALVGMSGRFPSAKDNEAFWDLLYKGLDVHKPVPALHWSQDTHVDPTGTRKNTSTTPFGCWLDDPGDFDARFFNISPREAPQIDPAQRLALMTAYEAIEQAGLVPDATPSTRRDRVGVFYGVTSNDWMETNSAQNIDTYFIPGGNRAFIPGRINYFFKFSGPSYAIDTACSSSLAGIHLACNALWEGDIDTAIAGGTNVLTNPDMTAGLDRGHFLSRTGNCKTFDDSADGYCRGEGVGTVIIKRLDDAIADDDPILGVILGAATNHSAESESITRPHAGAQEAIFNTILKQGGVDPYTVSYVEMHGTGTQAGDGGEMSSVLNTFAPALGAASGRNKVKGRGSDQALYLGSAKANIGHGEAASGVSGLIKVLMMMQKNTIVPHCGIKTKMNHKFPTDLASRNVNIALAPTAWPRSTGTARPRRAFVNNFSAAGGNTALLLEDAPAKSERATAFPHGDPRSHHLVAVSAKSGVSLAGNLRTMLRFVKENPGVSLGQLSYTTTARRVHHPHRVMLAVETADELCTQIESALSNKSGVSRSKSSTHVVFAFTGQGAQYPGMGKQLLANVAFFRAEIQRLDQMVQTLGFPSVMPLLHSDAPDVAKFSPTVVQVANLCLQIALVKLWADWGIRPAAVVGHSLGEYAALNAAGVLSDSDALFLVGNRAQLLEKTCTRDTHAMLVVRDSVNGVLGVLGQAEVRFEVACINSPTETVVAGLAEAMAGCKQVLAEAGIKSTLLAVPYAFHSSQIDPVLEDFTQIARGVEYHKAQVPILCPLDGSIVPSGGGDFGPDYLALHSRQPVNMLQALRAARGSNILTDQTTVLEIGPHPAVSSMVQSALGTQISCVASIHRGRPAWQILSKSLRSMYNAGASVDWHRYHADFKASHEVLPLPAYSWDLKHYWLQYVNDWSLRKGDAPLTAAPSSLESTTIHRVVEETTDAAGVHIVVEADIARKDLSPLVQGHEVDGVPLCTPSVYADMALSLGSYMLKRYRPDHGERLVDVSDMVVSKALILRAGATTQLLQAHAEANWAANAVAVRFTSFDNRQKLQEHARCVIRFKDGESTLHNVAQDAIGIKQKMTLLRDGIVTGTTSRYNRPMVYRAIRPLARFHDDYRAIDEMVLNSATLEASSRLSFGTVKRSGSFHTHPAVIDSLTQSCGFTMNCNDSTDLDVEVHMNHGWGSLCIFEPIDFDKVYTTYTRMTEGADKLWQGNVFVFDGDTVVAYLGQVAIQAVPRRVLKIILSIESGGKVQNQRPTSVTATALEQVAGSSRVNGSSSMPTSAKALQIIVEESGIALSDLTDNTVFADIGVDSLLGLTVSARFKEELDVDLDFTMLFFEYPTVASLKAFLSDEHVHANGGSSGSSTDNVSPEYTGTGTTTPDGKSSTPGIAVFQHVLSIISEESGLALQDLTDESNFADMGVDSLLSLVVTSRIRDELDLEIWDESLLLECLTVGDLKRRLIGKEDTSPVVADTPGKAEPVPLRVTKDGDAAARRKAVDDYVAKYSSGFIVNAPARIDSSMLPMTCTNNKVVLVTGASGSLGGNLVYHLAQLPDVKTVICLNRENKAEPYARQQKAMRDKGIRFPEALKEKLVVLQTDSTQPLLGLGHEVYENLAASVTHLIHNAWPMSAKRDLAGFESQFQIMRRLVDLASDAVSRRWDGFCFSFQLVSSIGVVGLYGGSSDDIKTKIMVPEDRVDIDAVLPNGYGQAKWGCERMLDATLHQQPHARRFHAMVVRLGQIAGSSTSGYWNPMEHFGFLVKSSQTLGALPEVPDGSMAYWTPVNEIAGALADLVLADDEREVRAVYHVENPVGQSWRALNDVLAEALGIRERVPFQEWLSRVRAAPQHGNPAATLLEFLEMNYLNMSCGGLVLDVTHTLKHSATLSAVGPVGDSVVKKYIHVWREIGFLS